MRELPPPPPAQRASKEARLALPAPIIRGAASATPVLRLPADEPLPQFTVWADDTSDTDKTTKRGTPTPPGSVDVSDADVTLPRPSKLPNFADEAHFDWAPTIKRPALTPSDAAAVLLAKRFRATTQLGGGDAPAIKTPTKKADTLRPVVAAADSTEELDLDEIEELPLEPRDTIVDLSSKHLVDASTQIKLDFAEEESIPLVPDTTLEVMALQRRRRVRRVGSRAIAACVAVGVLVLGIGGVRLGFRDLASSLEITYTTPSKRDAKAAAPKPAKKKEDAKPAPVVTATTATTTTTAKPATTTAPKSIATPKNALPTTKAAPLPPPKKPATKMGTLHTPAAAAGHRVYVDGFLSGFAPNPIPLKCGTHSVKVGSAGKVQSVNVPCGGDAWAK